MKKLNQLILYSILIVVGFITMFPFFWMLQNSFNSGANVFSIPPKLIPDLLFKKGMFSNYITVFSEYNFGRFTMNSFIVAGLSSFGQVVTCTLAGFAFALMNFKGKKVIFTLIMATMMVPVQVTIIPEFFLMLKLGWLDSFAPLIIPSLLIGTFGTFMFKEFFEGMPRSLLDAGVIDGANTYMVYARIYLPQSTAQIATLFIIAFMNNWNDLLRPILYINSEKLYTLTIALTQFKSQYTAQWNLLLTGGVLSIIPLLLIYIFLQRFIIQGIASTGTKG